MDEEVEEKQSGWKRLRTAAQEYVVATAGGLVMILVGFILAALEPIPLRVLGSFVSGIGGILVSWSVTTSYSKEQALYEQNLHIQTLSRHLGTAASHIRQAVSGVHSGEHNTESALALIQQSTSNLYAVLEDAQVLSGNRFRTEGLIDTAEQVNHLTKSLASSFAALSSAAVREPSESLPESSLAEIQEEFSRNLAKLTTALQPGEKGWSRYEPVSVDCPECGNSGSANLGIFPGSTAVATCVKCNSRYNVHRRSDGSFFTNRPGGTTQQTVGISCPTCSYQYSVNYYSNEIGVRHRYCVRCGATSWVKIPEGIVVKSEPTKIVEGMAIVGNQGRWFVDCQICGQRRPSFYLDGESVFAECIECERLVRASLPNGVGIVAASTISSIEGNVSQNGDSPFE